MPLLSSHGNRCHSPRVLNNNNKKTTKSRTNAQAGLHNACCAALYAIDNGWTIGARYQFMFLRRTDRWSINM